MSRLAMFSSIAYRVEDGAHAANLAEDNGTGYPKWTESGTCVARARLLSLAASMFLTIRQCGRNRAAGVPRPLVAACLH